LSLFKYKTSPDTINEDKLLCALLKVLDILSQQSREEVLSKIEKRYGFPLENQIRCISASEIEETMVDIFGQGAQLIIRMVKAEYQRIL